MKTFSIDFGIEEINPKKIFEHKGVKWAIAEVPRTYMNNKEKFYMKGCLHFSSGRQMLIWNLSHKATIKEWVEKSKDMIDQIIKDLGEDEFFKELNNLGILNYENNTI